MHFGEFSLIVGISCSDGVSGGVGWPVWFACVLSVFHVRKNFAKMC